MLVFEEAANYAAKKVMRELTGGGETFLPELLPEWCEQKLIDLDRYGMGQYILYLFSQGGGTHTLENMSDFWQAVGVHNDVLMIMKYQAYTIVIGGTTRFTQGIMCANMAFNFMVSDGANTYSVSVSIARDQNNAAIITVKVT